MAQQTETTNHEIDLDQISKKVKNVIGRTNDSVFDGILFIKRNIIIIAVLLIVGAAFGYYKDKKTSIYEHTILVKPNFGSVDYLYEQIKNINAKIAEGDTGFLNSIGINEDAHLAKIEIDPVVDIYNYVAQEEGLNIIQTDNMKFLIFRQIADKRDMTEVLEEYATSKNYKSHLITITTAGSISKKEDVINPILDYLNSSNYFKDVQKEAIKSLDRKIAENDSMVKQANAILDRLSNKNNVNPGMLLLNEKKELNDILVIKDQLIRQQANNMIHKIDYNSIIKETTTIVNNKKHSLLSNKMKYIYPILLLMIFFALMSFKNYYVRQVNKRKVIIQ